MTSENETDAAVECSESVLDPEDQEIFESAFEIVGDIDEDIQKSQQDISDDGNPKSDSDAEMDEENADIKILDFESRIEEDDECDEIQEIVVFIEEYNQENNLLLKEESLVDRFTEHACCKLRCNQRITREEFLKYRQESQELDYNEQGVNQLDTIMLGVLRVISRGGDECKVGRIMKKIDRKRVRPNFLLGGLHVCKATFLFAHSVTSKRFKRLLKNFKEGGLYLKTHGNYGRLSSRKVSVETVQKAVDFIRQYADCHTKTTARHTRKKRNVKILSHTETKTNVYKQYREKCAEENIVTPISSRTFLRIWKQCCNEILIQRAPAKSDHCNKCHPLSSDKADPLTLEQ